MFLALTEIQYFWMLIMILLSVAFFSLFERKALSALQYRKGPEKISWMGLLQPISDAMKLLTKFNLSPNQSSKFSYNISPVLFMVMSLSIWPSIPLYWGVDLVQSSFLMIMLCFSISVYGIISMGWFSNSKYSLLGSIRSIAQSISYEVVLSFSIFSLMICCMSFSVISLVKIQELTWLFFPLLPIALLVFITFLAEANRTPFDLSEGESELVSGYCVEYGSASYTIVFLSENVYLMFMSYIFVILFMSNMIMFFLKLILVVWVFVLVRATMPRIRFDKVMNLCWLVLMPMSLISVGMICLFT